MVTLRIDLPLLTAFVFLKRSLRGHDVVTPAELLALRVVITFENHWLAAPLQHAHVRRFHCTECLPFDGILREIVLHMDSRVQ